MQSYNKTLLERKKRKIAPLKQVLNQQNNSIAQPNHWKSFTEEGNEATKFLNLRKDCFRHTIDTFYNECDAVKKAHKSDNAVPQIEQFIRNYHKEWKILVEKRSGFWWKQLPVVTLLCGSSELAQQLLMFGEVLLNDNDEIEEQRMEDEYEEIVFHIDTEACKTITTLLTHFITRHCNMKKMANPTFDTLVKWYQENTDDNIKPPIVVIWDDVDTLPSYKVLHAWLQLCVEEYARLPIYNVLRVSNVKATTTLSSVMLHNLSQRVLVQSFRTRSSMAFLFYKILDRLFIRNNKNIYVRPGYETFKFMLNHFLQKSMSVLDFQHQIKHLYQFFFHANILSFLAPTINRFAINSNQYNLVTSSLLLVHKNQLSRMMGEEFSVEEMGNSVAEYYQHRTLLPSVVNLLEKSYRILKLKERDVTDDGEEEEEEAVLQLRVKIYESLLEPHKPISKNHYFSEIIKLLQSDTITVDMLNEFMRMCSQFFSELNKLLSGQLKDEEQMLQTLMTTLLDPTTIKQPDIPAPEPVATTTSDEKEEAESVQENVDEKENEEEELKKATKQKEHEERVERMNQREEQRKKFKEEQCGSCSKEFGKKDVCVCCDECNQWYHAVCTDSFDSHMHDNDEPWFCNSCKVLICSYCNHRTSNDDCVFCEDCKQKFHHKCIEEHRHRKLDLSNSRFLCQTCSESCLLCNTRGTNAKRIKCEVCNQQFCVKCLNNNDLKVLKKKGGKCYSCSGYQDIRKKLKSIAPMPEGMRASCENILALLRSAPEGYYFNQPVSVLFKSQVMIDDYLKSIKNVMDFGTVEQKLKLGFYATAIGFIHDLKLIWNNCYEYYGNPNNSYAKAAKVLENLFNQEWPDLQAEVEYQESLLQLGSGHVSSSGASRATSKSTVSTHTTNRRRKSRRRSTYAQSSSGSSSSGQSSDEGVRKSMIDFLSSFFQNYYEHYTNMNLHKLFYFEVEDCERFFAHTICSHQLDLMENVTKSMLNADAEDEEMEPALQLRKDLSIGYSTYKNVGSDSRSFHMLEWFQQFATYSGISQKNASVQARFALVVRTFMHLNYVKPSNSPWILEKQLL